jgi:hypothetical protein
MLPIGAALGFTSPASVVGEWTVRSTVGTLPFGSALRWVRLPATLTCSHALRLVTPTTMASADFCPDRSRQISPGKNTMLPRATAAFTSPGKPDDFAVLCQLVVPDRPSMRFLFIGSQVSPSLPSPGRLPFLSWLQMVVSSFSCLVFLQGTFTPFTSRPCWAHTNHCSARAGAGHSGFHGAQLRGSGTPLSLPLR